MNLSSAFHNGRTLGTKGPGRNLQQEGACWQKLNLKTALQPNFPSLVGLTLHFQHCTLGVPSPSFREPQWSKKKTIRVWFLFRQALVQRAALFWSTSGWDSFGNESASQKDVQAVFTLSECVYAGTWVCHCTTYLWKACRAHGTSYVLRWEWD